MREKFRNGIDIMKACWKVFLLDKELLVFPLLTALVLGLLVAGLVWPYWASQTLPEFLFVTEGEEQETLHMVWTAALTFVAYFVTYFVMIFFNSALIACVKIRFADRKIDYIMSGLP